MAAARDAQHRGTRRKSFTIRMLLSILLACNVCLASAQQPPPPPTTTTPSLATSPPIPEQNGVLILSERTFGTAARAFDPLFVLFDSSARYGSLTLQRRFSDAARAVRAYDWTADTNARFASLDVSELSHTLPYELKVLGLPALLLFHCLPAWPVSNEQNSINVTLSNCAATRGGVEVYTGGRTSMEFQRFVLGQPLREAIEITTKAELDVVVRTRPFVVLFLVDGDDSQAFIDCRVLAQVDSDATAYVVTTNEMILSQANAGTQQQHSDDSALHQIPALVLFREFGQERVMYDDDWNKAALLQFIQKNRYNLISTYTENDASYFYDHSAVAHVLLFSDPRASYHATLTDEAQDLAFYYYNPSNNPGGYMLRFLVVTKDQETLKNALFVLDDQFPTVLVVRNVSQAPTRMPFVGNKTLELIENQTIGHAISDALEKIFPPYATADLPDDDGSMEQLVDWRDYSDLFENRRAPFIVRPPTTTTQASAPTSAAMFAPQTVNERRLGEVDMDPSALSSAKDQFLSIFTHPKSSNSATALEIVEVLDFGRLQSLLVQHERNEMYHRHRHCVLVVLHSPRCYSCRQAMDALQSLPPTSGVTTLVIVNVDRVDVREWPFRFQWLPGIFLFSGTDQVAMFPSRTVVTVDALQDFVDRATIGSLLYTPSHIM